MTMNLLHLYAQKAWHDEANIIGTTAALIDLKNAIDVALQIGKSGVLMKTSDGEGYSLLVDCIKEETDLPLPYTDI